MVYQTGISVVIKYLDPGNAVSPSPNKSLLLGIAEPKYAVVGMRHENGSDPDSGFVSAATSSRSEEVYATRVVERS